MTIMAQAEAKHCKLHYAMMIMHQSSAGFTLHQQPALV